MFAYMLAVKLRRYVISLYTYIFPVESVTALLNGKVFSVYWRYMIMNATRNTQYYETLSTFCDVNADSIQIVKNGDYIMHNTDRCAGAIDKLIDIMTKLHGTRCISNIIVLKCELDGVDILKFVRQYLQYGTKCKWDDVMHHNVIRYTEDSVLHLRYARCGKIHDKCAAMGTHKNHNISDLVNAEKND